MRSNVRDFHIYTITLPNANIHDDNNNNKTKTKIMHILILDNSGSMGSNSKKALDTFGAGLFGKNPNELPGAIIVFDIRCSLIDGVTGPESFANYKMPSQGCTNITLAFETAFNYIDAHQKKYPNKDKDKDQVHYILTFLSDGQHNEGPKLDNHMIAKLRTIVDTHMLNLSLIVVGISSSDTALGMMAKTSLETVPIEQLQSVYYARDFTQMNTVLADIIEGLNKSLQYGSFRDIEVVDGVFLNNFTNTTRVFVDVGEIITLCVKANVNKIPSLMCDGKIIHTADTPFDVTMVSTVVNDMLPHLSRLKIAHGFARIKDQVSSLEALIKIAEDLISSVDNVDKNINMAGLKSNERLKLFKRAKTAKLTLSEEKNKLQSLLTNICNDSAQQAKYLIGMGKKYANKAVATSNTLSVDLKDVIKEIVEIRQTLHDSLEMDKKNCHQDPSNTSLLSLATTEENFTEWLNVDTDDINCLYSLLVAYGFTGYPVKFALNNAVQMDPFQTRCENIEPFMVDSSSILLANQLEHVVTTPSRTPFSDIIILVDPACPTTTKLLMRTSAYKYLCSVTLCKDLYMYKGSMTYSMYSHALLQTLNLYNENKSTAYLELALRIVYSFKTIFHIGDELKGLFNRWWNELGTITTSLADNCCHPIKLLLLMTVSSANYEKDYRLPLLNLLNEILAKAIKLKFVDGSTNTVRLAQKLYKIEPQDCPTPGEDLQVEPRPQVIQESCSGKYEGVDLEEFERVFGHSSIRDYLNSVFVPYVRMFEFIRAVCIEGYGWMQELEQTGKFSDTILNAVAKVNEIDDAISYLELDGREEVILLQSLLHYTSDTRKDITDHCVLDDETMVDMIVSLQMEHYNNALGNRKKDLIKYISSIPVDEISAWDLDVFIRKLGTHTHGLSKELFWAYLTASLFDSDKEGEFLKKSNSTVAGVIHDRKKC